VEFYIYSAKTQSGGDFVCHILQKMKTVWLTLFLNDVKVIKYNSIN